LSIIYRKFLKKLRAKITLNPSLLDGWTRNSLQKQEGDKGVKGMLPLGCLPLWGREGVSLIAFLKKWRVTGFFTKP